MIVFGGCGSEGSVAIIYERARRERKRDAHSVGSHETWPRMIREWNGQGDNINGIISLTLTEGSRDRVAPSVSIALLINRSFDPTGTIP